MVFWYIVAGPFKIRKNILLVYFCSQQQLCFSFFFSPEIFVKLAENWQIYLHSCTQTLVRDREEMKNPDCKKLETAQFKKPTNKQSWFKNLGFYNLLPRGNNIIWFWAYILKEHIQSLIYVDLRWLTLIYVDLRWFTLTVSLKL